MRKITQALSIVGCTFLVVGIVYAFTLAVSSTVEINSSTPNGPTLSNVDQFGYSVANIGDLNDDGVEDVVVGAFGDDEGGSLRGAVHIFFLNDDGSVDSTAEINSSTPNGPTLNNIDTFGGAVAALGDLNNDGVEDIAVGAHNDDEGGDGRGAVHILFLTTTGAVLSTVEINSSTPNGPTLSNNDGFGSAIANIGDLNDDGVDDLIVGAYLDSSEGTYRGAAHIVFLNTDGSVDGTVKINGATANGPTLENSSQFGGSVAALGDLNDDGVEDIAVGTPGDNEGGTNRGAMHILFLNDDGSVDSTVEINSSTPNGPTLSNSDLFGVSVANIGDLNDDGVIDIAVGAYYDDEGGDTRGAVHIFFLNDDGSVSSATEINSSTPNGPTLADEDYFGKAVAALGDLNNDGVEDIAVGAHGDDEGGDTRGAVHILFLADAPETSSSGGGSAYQHRRIRERYAQIAAGLHGSADEEKNDTEAPSLSDVGIFVAGTGSTVQQETEEEPEEEAEETPLSRRVLQVMEKLQNMNEETQEQAEEVVERTPFEQRVCERVWRRFSGSSLERVNERLQRRLGFVCER